MLAYNMVFEDCFYKAISASPELHRIKLMLNETDMRDDFIVHVIHVEVTWMKELEIDELYRGDFLEGVMFRKYHLVMLIWRLEHCTDQEGSSSG